MKLKHCKYLLIISLILFGCATEDDSGNPSADLAGSWDTRQSDNSNVCGADLKIFTDLRFECRVWWKTLAYADYCAGNYGGKITLSGDNIEILDTASSKTVIGKVSMPSKDRIDVSGDLSNLTPCFDLLDRVK
jgi:hypothetical protein